MWFPIPADPTDIHFVGTAGTLSRRQIFALLVSSSATEWRDLVGVAGPVEGSGKDSSRLLASDGWVLKTNMDLAVQDEAAVFASTRKAVEIGVRTQIWHHEKTWAYFLFENSWFPLSATPEMTTLRRVASEDERLAAWTKMLIMAVDTALAHDIGMDLNPANFGQIKDDKRLYYLDDEWYPKLSYAELAAATVARIPEEPGIDAEKWESWGAVLAKSLEPLCATSSERMDLVDHFADHPIAAKFQAKRKALLSGLHHIHPKRHKSSGKTANGRKSGSQSKITAIIADVHANSVALDAVLAETRELGADSYIFLGDAVGYGPKPKECIQRLAELPNTHFVRGNHDHAISIGVYKEGMNGVARRCAQWSHDQLSKEEREWLMSLPLDAKGPGWLAVHGAPKDPRRFLAYVYELTYHDNLDYMVSSDLALCFFGHTHVQSVYEQNPAGESFQHKEPQGVEARNGRVLLVNPGSVGQSRDGDNRAAFAMWDRKSSYISLHRIRYAVSDVVASINEAGLPSVLGERLLRGA